MKKTGGAETRKRETQKRIAKARNERRLAVSRSFADGFSFLCFSLWVFAVLFVSLSCQQPLLAIGGVPGQTSGSSAESSSFWSLRDVPLDFLAGASVFKGEPGIALAVRIIPHPAAAAATPSPFKGEGRGEGWSFEVGGILPHPVSGYASDGAVSVAPPITAVESVRVRSFGETHAVALYSLYQSPRLPGRPGCAVDVGAGLSVAFVDNEIDQQVTGGINDLGPEHDHATLVGPRLQIGVAAALTNRISVRLDVAWVDYANHDSSGVHNFNLGFSGVMITPMLEVRL